MEQCFSQYILVRGISASLTLIPEDSAPKLGSRMLGLTLLLARGVCFRGTLGLQALSTGVGAGWGRSMGGPGVGGSLASLVSVFNLHEMSRCIVL